MNLPIPVHFGARQINDENWTTSPLYRLSVPSGGLNHELPLTVTLRRVSDALKMTMTTLDQIKTWRPKKNKWKS